MRKSIVAAGFAALAMLPAQSATAEPVAFEVLLKEIKLALLKVQQSPDAGDIPALESATLHATTVQKRVKGGTFKLFILEFGKKRTSELTTDVSIVLAPPDANGSADASTANVADTLSKAILSAARAIKAAKVGSPPLRAREVKASIKFGISQDSAGKISLEFLPTAPGIDVGASNSSAQEIVIVYKG